jgi:hypothetical protein
VPPGSRGGNPGGRLANDVSVFETNIRVVGVGACTRSRIQFTHSARKRLVTQPLSPFFPVSKFAFKWVNVYRYIGGLLSAYDLSGRGVQSSTEWFYKPQLRCFISCHH